MPYRSFNYFKLRILLLVALLLSIPASAFAVNCGDYITRDVRLTSNLHCTSGYFALEVLANDVSIDLNGFTISGSDELAGIIVSGYDKVKIVNGTIRDFWVGVNSSRANQLTVENVNFYQVGHGVVISSGNAANLQDNDFIETRGIAVSIFNVLEGQTANQNRISNNEFYRVYSGVNVCGDQADKNQIENNLLWKTVDIGIHLNQSDRNTLDGNRILETIDGSAIRLNNASYNTLSNNVLSQGGHVGVAVLGDAGDACLTTKETQARSVKNKLSNNRISYFSTAINLGLDVPDPHLVEGNGLLNNTISDNAIGVYFASSSYSNYAKGNAFTRTTTHFLDDGLNNHY